MPFFLIMAAVFFILVRFVAGDSVGMYYFLMFFCGFFLGGPFNIISSAIAADLVNFFSHLQNFNFFKGEKSSN